MADNVTLNTGSGGDTIGADDISSVKYQRIKLIHGTDGSNDGDVAYNNPLPVLDAALGIAQGNVTGKSVVHKFGRNPTISTGTVPEDVWSTGGTMNWPTAAAVVSVVSTSTNDDGAPTTNTGGQTLTIEGLDSSFDILTETITLNGTTAATSSGSFIRINRAYLATVGTYHGSNLGTITGTVGGSTMFSISIGDGQTHLGRYTVPNAYTAYIKGAIISVSGSASANVALYRYPNADDTSQPYSGAVREALVFDGITGTTPLQFDAPIKFDGKTDIWWQVEDVSANNTSVSVDFEIQLVAD